VAAANPASQRVGRSTVLAGGVDLDDLPARAGPGVADPDGDAVVAVRVDPGRRRDVEVLPGGVAKAVAEAERGFGHGPVVGAVADVD
jgi:hypothetical protein